MGDRIITNDRIIQAEELARSKCSGEERQYPFQMIASLRQTNKGQLLLNTELQTENAVLKRRISAIAAFAESVPFTDGDMSDALTTIASELRELILNKD